MRTSAGRDANAANPPCYRSSPMRGQNCRLSLQTLCQSRVVVLNDERHRGRGYPRLIEGAHECHGWRPLSEATSSARACSCTCWMEIPAIPKGLCGHQRRAAAFSACSHASSAVVLNKMDLPGRASSGRGRRTRAARRAVLAISGANNEGVRELVQHIGRRWRSFRPNRRRFLVRPSARRGVHCRTRG